MIGDGALSPPTGVQFVPRGLGDWSDEPGNNARVERIVRFAQGPSSTSVTWVSIHGRHRRLASLRSARCYYLLSGELVFTFDSGQECNTRAGDTLVIPRNCVYGLEGTATYLVMNTPAFEAGDDRYVDDM
jgi:uncharacterized cupin superfamily protein